MSIRNATTTFVLLVTFSACSPPPDPRQTNFEITKRDVYAKYDPGSGKLQRINIDQDKNGRMDTFSYWDGPRLNRIEIDRDEDGKIDKWEHYDEHSKLVSVGSSSKGDHVEDTWAYPDAEGFLARVESDTDRDGLVDKREIFVPIAGQPNTRVISVVEIGIDRSGVPAQRLHYRADGTFEKTETLR